MQAVAELADRDIVHRDLKPENIIIKGIDNSRRSADGKSIWAPNIEISPSQVYLTDFGFSLDLKKKSQLPVGLGTLSLSPEQAKLQAFAENAQNTKADVYCCGIVFYEMYFTLTQDIRDQPFQACPQGPTRPQGHLG